MFNTLKTKIQENPERTKKVAVVAGAVVGLALVATVIYMSRDGLELPFGVEDIDIEVPTE